MSAAEAALPPASLAADRWALVLDLPCQLSVQVPVPHFTIRDLLYLRRDSLVETGCKQSSYLPVHVNRRLIAAGEFEVIGEKLAVRLTELA